MLETINVVEPTLETEAGHCYSFVSAFCKAGKESQVLRLWVSRRAKLAFPGENIQIGRYFFRNIRRLQSYILYKKLLAIPGKLLVSTAGRTDLQLIDWASRDLVAPKKVYLYFHWFSASDKKLAGLKAIARRQPNLVILGPTPSVVKVFRDAGFNDVRLVPYPIFNQDADHQAVPNKFRYLLYAGAARQDKGFSHVVDLVAYLHECGLQIPVLLQTSSEHYGKIDEATQADIRRLQGIKYPHLRLCPETLNRSEYAELFAGGVCLQLYDQSDFMDRISGVTLDAFSFGSPTVASAGTWIARMVQRFEAGVIVEDVSPPQVLAAAQSVIAEYAKFNKNALAAAKILQEEHNAAALFRALSN